MENQVTDTLVSRKEAAELLGCSKTVIERMLRDGTLSGSGHKVWRSTVERTEFRPYDCCRTVWHRDFFRRNDPTTAYWAGFVMADGSIHQTTGAGSPQLSVNLSVKDEGHLQRFAADLGLLPDAVRHYTSGMCTLVVRGPTLLEDLKVWGICQNKTERFIPPTINDDVLLGHYFRGVLDGDGTVWSNRQGCTCLRISGNAEFLHWTGEQLVRMGLPWRPKLYDVNPNNIWCNLQLTGIWPVAWAYKTWYGDSQLRLDRKWSKVDTFLNGAGWATYKNRFRNQKDVDAAVKLIGRAPADKQGSIKKRIKEIAKRKGLKLPESWGD